GAAGGAVAEGADAAAGGRVEEAVRQEGGASDELRGGDDGLATAIGDAAAFEVRFFVVERLMSEAVEVASRVDLAEKRTGENDGREWWLELGGDVGGAETVDVDGLDERDLIDGFVQ